MAGVLVVPAITEDGLSNWPDRWSIERLQAKKLEITSIPFSSQYMLDPIDLGSPFLKREWLHFYLDKDLPPLVHYIGVDPSPSGRMGTDYFALAVLGVDAQHNGYLASAYRLQIGPLEQAQRIRLEAKIWRAAIVTVEAVAAQALFTRYILPDPEQRLPIVESTTRFPPEIRFVAMAPLFESSKIKIRGQLTQDEQGQSVIGPADSVSDFFDEWITFTPKSKLTDVLDAVDKAIEGARLTSGNPVFISAHPDNVPGNRTAGPAMASGNRLLRGSRSPLGRRRLRSRRVRRTRR